MQRVVTRGSPSMVHHLNLQAVPKKPIGFWKHKANHRKFLDKLASDLGLKSLDDWYDVTVATVEKKGAIGLISNYYGWSLSRALIENYPEHNWTIWKFQKVPHHFWTDPQHQKEFMDSLAKELGIDSMEKWYTVDITDIAKRGGEHLLKGLYGNSLYHLLKSVYPEYQWIAWLFPRAPKGFWDDMKNQRQFFDWLMHPSRLNLKSLDNWYNVHTHDILKYGGSFLLSRHYNFSLGKAVRAIYPEHDWKLWRFERVPHGYWSDNANIIEFFQYCSQQFSITHLSDWLGIETALIRKAGGTTLLNRFGGFIPLLQHVYPSINWNSLPKRTLHSRDSKFTSKAQRFLFNQVQKLLPDVEILQDYKHKDIVFKNTNRWMEFDMFIPSLSLVIEYHGEQHFDRSYLFGSKTYQQVRDAEKRELCKERGLTLIEIPYWWDRTPQSLAATIHKHRPTLLEKPQGAEPISEEEPK